MTVRNKASAAVLVSNLGGLTGLLLGTDGGHLAGKLKVDALFPVRGLKRCINYEQRFGKKQHTISLAQRVLNLIFCSLCSSCFRMH